MALAQQFIDRNGGTPGTFITKANFGALAVSDSFIKVGGGLSATGLVITYSSLVVVINSANSSPAVEVIMPAGTYAITGAASTDNYVYLSLTGIFTQISVPSGSAKPTTPVGTICLWKASVNSGGTAFTATPSTVSSTKAQLLATSVAAAPDVVIPGFTWDATKTIRDQLAALIAALASLTGFLQTSGANAPPILPLLGVTLTGDLKLVNNHILTYDTQGTPATLGFSVPFGFPGPLDFSIDGNDIAGFIQFGFGPFTVTGAHMYTLCTVTYKVPYPVGYTPIPILTPQYAVGMVFAVDGISNTGFTLYGFFAISQSIPATVYGLHYKVMAYI